MFLRKWDDLRILLALHEHGTMTDAARSLNLNTATVSRRVDNLTVEIGTTLFVRHGTDWKATATGHQLILAAESILAKIQNVNLPSSNSAPLKTSVRLSAELEILSDAVSSRLRAFLTEKPEISLSLSDGKKSIALGEADVRLSFDEPANGRLVRYAIGSVKYAVFVHEQFVDGITGYIEISGEGRDFRPHLDDLRLDYGEPRLVTACPAEATTVASSVPLAVCLPTRFANRQSGIIMLHSSIPETEYPVWATYHESRRLDPNVRVILEFLETYFGQ